MRVPRSLQPAVSHHEAICAIGLDWIDSIGLDPSLFGTHSLRRTKSDTDLPAHRKPQPQGRVKTGTSFPKLSICEAAQKAHARNSPAAPGLEAKCAAARNAASDTAVEEQVDTAGKGKALPPKDEACDWRGEAPFCNGRCAPGEIKMAAENDSEAPFPRAHPDFGTSCATGSKFYCCRQ